MHMDGKPSAPTTEGQKQTILSNRENQYVDDPEKQSRVGEWLRDCLTVAEAKGCLGVPGLSEDVKVETFADAFPEDHYVQSYQATPTPQNRNKLLFHIAIAEKQLPVASTFALYGLTSERLLTKLARHVDSNKDDVSLKAIELALKYIHPTEKPIRVYKQNNTQINVQDDARKKELIDRILAQQTKGLQKVGPKGPPSYDERVMEPNA